MNLRPMTHAERKYSYNQSQQITGQTGCIGCSLCVKVCPSGAVTVTDFHAHIDQNKCTGCGACKEKCPKKAIV